MITTVLRPAPLRGRANHPDFATRTYKIIFTTEYDYFFVLRYSP